MNKKNNNTKKIASYAATAAAFLLTSEADADIIYTPADITVNLPGSVNINMDGDGLNDFKIIVSGLTYSVYNFIVPIYVDRSVAVTTAITYIARNFAAGDPISNGGNFLNGNVYLVYQTGVGTIGNFTNAGYIGVRFKISGSYHYGWIHVASVEGDYTSLTIDGWAYESVAGVSIAAGAMELFFAATATGSWSTLGTWKTRTTYSSDPGDYTVAATEAPTSANSEGIIINVDVTVGANVSVDQCVINSGKILTINSGSTLTIVDGKGVDLDNNGTIINNGTLAELNGTLPIDDPPKFYFTATQTKPTTKLPLGEPKSIASAIKAKAVREETEYV